MANALTFFRIICGLILLIFTAFSPGFYVFYLLGGFTDMIDGTVARKTPPLLWSGIIRIKLVRNVKYAR